MDMKEQIAQIRAHVTEEMRALDGTQALESLRVKVLGKKGELTALLRGMGQLSPEERPRRANSSTRPGRNSPPCWTKSSGSSRPSSRRRPCAGRPST